MIIDTLDEKDRIILKFFGILSLVPLINWIIPENSNSRIFTLFIPCFVISYSIHGTPLAIRLRKLKVSLIWLFFSLVLIVDYLILYWDYRFKELFPMFLFLPFISLILYHTLRLIYIMIFDREPITLWVSRFIANKVYVKDLKRQTDKFDVYFTMISWFSYFGLIYFIIRLKY